MRKPISIIVPFVAAVGADGSVTLLHDDRCGDKAHVAIDMGCPISGVKATAPLTLDGMRQLVDGLMDCIYALKRNARIAGKEDK